LVGIQTREFAQEARALSNGRGGAKSWIGALFELRGKVDPALFFAIEVLELLSRLRVFRSHAKDTPIEALGFPGAALARSNRCDLQEQLGGTVGGARALGGAVVEVGKTVPLAMGAGQLKQAIAGFAVARRRAQGLGQDVEG